MEEKTEDDLLKSRVQRVEGHKWDLTTFLSAIMKYFNHTEASLQWIIACEGIDVNRATAYMKYISGNSYITFQSKNGNWTLSDDQVSVIMRSFYPEYAQNEKDILKKECEYWDNYTPQRVTAIPTGTTSTVSEETSSVPPKITPETGGVSYGPVIIGVFFGLLCLAGIIWSVKIGVERLLSRRNERIPHQVFMRVPVQH